MNAYEIEVILKVNNRPAGAYSDITLAESVVKKKITCYARDVRQHCTKIVRQAVDNMSESVQTALAQVVKTEVVEVESSTEPAALEV